MLAHKSGSGPVPRSEPDETGEETNLLARVAAGESEALLRLEIVPDARLVGMRELTVRASARDQAGLPIISQTVIRLRF